MQFKKLGNRIQVLAYRGYDKVKKRAVIKVQGSIVVGSYELSDGLLNNLTDEEKIELQSYINIERQSEYKKVRLCEAQELASLIKKVSDTIKEGDFAVSPTWAADALESMAQLTKTLRKAGYGKPRKTAQKASEAAPEGQTQLNLGVNKFYGQ